jgi:hypothetical protein
MYIRMASYRTLIQHQIPVKMKFTTISAALAITLGNTLNIQMIQYEMESVS